MNKSPELLEQQVGQYLNQQSADLTILKVTMQILIWNLIRRDPNAASALGHLKDEVLASLYKTMSAPPADGQNAQELDRLRQLILIRAERMFQDIERTLGATKESQTPGIN